MTEEELEQQLTSEIEASKEESGDIFALTEKVEYNKEELSALITCVEPVMQLLVLAAASISKDVNNLPIQVAIKDASSLML